VDATLRSSASLRSTGCRLLTSLLRAAVWTLVGGLSRGAQRIEPPNPTLTPPARNPLVSEGDTHYDRRQEGRAGDRADSREILAAVAAFQTAAEAPDNAEARWKLARALYFRGEYTGLEVERRRAVFETARRVSEEAIGILGRRAGGTAKLEEHPPAKAAEALRNDSDALPTFFWAAVSWGEWSLYVGKVAAARMGAAARIRDAANIVIALDPTFEEGGGNRILGRLHDQAASIPILTCWVSRKDALANLRRAVEFAAQNIVNRHFLAEALAHGSAAERVEAIQIEDQVVAAAPSPVHLVEEIHIQEEAKRNLAQWKR
jgi:tetratricopeptide (TPR) repeat protein